MTSHINNLTPIEQRHRTLAIYLALLFSIFLFLDFLIVSLIYTWADWVATLIFSLLLIVPGYISNAGMVIVGGGKPIDANKNFFDGRRLFGAHKTWRGFLLGPLYVGIPISMGIFLIFILLWPNIETIIALSATAGQYKLYTSIAYYQFYFIGGSFPIGLIILLFRIILCSYGASIGDLIGSFLKRRFNIESGKPFWIVDQLDFMIFSIFFISVPGFFLPELFFIPDLNIFIFLLILTPAVSIIANTVAYLIGLKDVPW